MCREMQVAVPFYITIFKTKLENKVCGKHLPIWEAFSIVILKRKLIGLPHVSGSPRMHLWESHHMLLGVPQCILLGAPQSINGSFKCYCGSPSTYLWESQHVFVGVPACHFGSPSTDFWEPQLAFWEFQYVFLGVPAYFCGSPTVQC